MACIFRHNVAPVDGVPENGYSLLLSVLDPQTGKHEVLSQVDNSFIKHLHRYNKEAWSGNLDTDLVETYIEEVTAHGPARPVRLEKAPVSLKASPLSIVWGDFALRQYNGVFHLSFREPESGGLCRLALAPERPRMFVHEERSRRVDSMSYATYPTMRLKGKAGGEPVSGEAWLDHQWGEYGGWLVNRPGKSRKLLGWDWFGINLDDGTELLATVHHNMNNSRPAGRFGVVRSQGRKPKYLSKITAVPQRRWESPRTHIVYPIEWRVKIGEIDADLLIEPLADDQEIGMFGMARAIWEGAGRVSGTIRGKRVSGRVRIELYGYGFIFRFKSYTDHFIAEMDKRLRDFFPRRITAARLQQFVGAPSFAHDPAAHTATLSKPVWDLIERRGKRWRSLFALLVLEAFGVRSQPFLKLFTVVPELTHSGALIVDDIEDDSLIRRGDECIHLRYGLDVSLNAANTIYYLPYILFADHPGISDKQRLELYRIMVRHAVRAHFGQGLDIYWSRNMAPGNLRAWLKPGTAGKIKQMYAYKTSTAIEGLSEQACVIARTNAQTLKACADFSRLFGVAFQIMDDIHNLSRSKKWTKMCGEDILSGKLTLVAFRALMRLKGADSRRLQAILCSKGARRKRAEVREAIDLIRGSGAVDVCRNEARRMFDEGWRGLSGVLPNSEPRIMLRMLCRNLLDINYDL